MRRSNIFKIGLIVAALAIVGLAIFGLVRGRTKTGILLEVVPSDARGMIDGSIKIKGGVSAIAAGEHTIVVARRGFADQQQTFSVSQNQITKVIVLLKPNSQEGLDYLDAHPDEVLKAEGLSGELFDQSVSEARDKNPIINFLPFEDREFRIDYGRSVKNPNDPDAVAIYIKYSSETGKTEALEWLKFKGFDPAALEIIYSEIPGF